MRKGGLFLLLGLLLVGCTTQTSVLKTGITGRNSHISASNSTSVTRKNKDNKEYASNSRGSLAAKQNNFLENRVVPVPYVNPSYNNSLVFFPKRSKAQSVEIKRTGGGLKVTVKNMPLNKFVNLVFGKILRASYFIDNNIQRRKDLVTVRMEKPLSPEQFMKMVKNILYRYGVSVQNRDGTLFIIPGRGLGKIKISTFVIGRRVPSDIPDVKTIAAIIPFYYVSPKNYMRLIKRLALSNSSEFSVVPGSNDLMIVDFASNIRKAIKIINIFDRLSFEKKTVVLIPLEYVSVSKFVDKLRNILPYQGVPVAGEREIRGALGIVLIPMPEINSVLVVSPKESWIRIIEFWKHKLDTVSALGSQPRFFVYYPKNRRASDLATIFNKIGYVVSVSKKGKKEKIVRSVGSGKVKVIVDQGRNALVILAPPEEYLQIKKVLEKIDTLPKEVLVQVTIAEITLTKNLQYGIEWYLRHSGKYSGVLQTIGGLGLGSGGLNYSIVSDTQKFQAILNAFARKNLINVISSPRLVVLDNKQATINVGTQVPTVNSETTSSNVQTEGTTNLVRTIVYRNTGVILNIRPTINSGGILTLDIDQTVSEPQVNNTSKIDSPLILNREINTSVVLKSGTTLLLGGLIKKNNSSTINKVPLLGDIPIIGNLFKTTSKGTTKTELIIEITPYIISNIGEAVERTKKFESLLKWFNNTQH